MEHIYFKFYKKNGTHEIYFYNFSGDSGSSQGLRKGNTNEK